MDTPATVFSILSYSHSCSLFLYQIFEAFGPVELVQLPLDPETGQCKGFGFIQVSGTCF